MSLLGKDRDKEVERASVFSSTSTFLFIEEGPEARLVGGLQNWQELHHRK
jgi:hypothetical protein